MADIYIHYGTNIIDMTRDLMRAGNIESKVSPSMRVCIKPNLVLAKPAEDGATTHPEIVEGIILYLKECGIHNIVIAEGAWVGGSTRQAWSVCGYLELARKYDVELLDTKDDRVTRVKNHGFELTLCKSVVDADYLINVPVLKGHCQTAMTCCLKNLKGCIPDSEKRRFHTIGLHKPIAALADSIKPDLHIIDNICGDLSFEEGGNPIESNRVILGFDPVLLDSFGAGLMGYEPREIKHLQYAKEFGVGKYADESTEIVELGTENRPKHRSVRSSQAMRYTDFIEENGACSACYSALIFALKKSGTLNLREKLYIGQGFKGQNPEGTGIGSCASGCKKSVTGCPPKAVDIVEFLKKL